MSIPYPYELSELIFLIPLTSLHLGHMASVSGVADLSIQRNKVTRYPIMRATSLKGALRHRYRLLLAEHKLSEPALGEKEIFGTKEGAGSYSVLDAQIFLIPTPSLNGAYAYITSPILLARFRQYAEVAGVRNELVRVIDNILCGIKIHPGTLKVSENSELVNEMGFVTLHGLTKFQAEVDERVSILEEKISNLIISRLNEWKLPPKRHVAILSDEDASYIINRSTLLIPRVKLNYSAEYATKTIDLGPWYEEVIPRDTILHTVFLYKETRISFAKEELKKLAELYNLLAPCSGFSLTIEHKNLKLKAQSVRQLIHFILRLISREPRSCGVIHIGGNESIGRGLLRVVCLEGDIYDTPTRSIKSS